MGDFNHGNFKRDSLQSTGVEDQRFVCLVQDNFLTQHVLEPTRAASVLDIVLSSQKEFVDNVVIQEPLGSSDHNELHFNINIKSDKSKVKQCRRDFRKGNYKEIRKSLALVDWDDKMKNKTATECCRPEIKESKITRGHNYTLVKKQSRLDVRKYSFSQRTIHVWNNLSTDCVQASSVNMFKNKIDKYLVKAGYT